MGSLPTRTGARVVLIDPKQPQRVYAADERTLYRSDDAGQTWQPADAGLPDGGVQALTLDPRESRRLYAATSSGELYLSDDGADTWQTLADAQTRVP